MRAVQQFEFATTGVAVETSRGPNILQRKVLPPKTRVGTIRLTLTRCVLERVETTSEKVATWGHVASRTELDKEKASHFTKLGSIHFDAPRKAYRLQSEQSDPWYVDVACHGRR
jgi:hypothetical protein